MELIQAQSVQEKLNRFVQREVYLHIETTNGAYAAHRNQTPNVGVFVRNAKVTINQAKITGANPYRVGMKIDHGWVYAEGLTHLDELDENSLLLYGLDEKGKLAVGLQMSLQPFKEEAL